MENLVSRPDIAADHAAKRNQDIFPPMISEIQESFGQEAVPVYLYNIGNQEFNTPRPPNHPHLLIRACPKGEEWILAGQITHPFKEVEYDQNGKKRINLTDGRREAQRMINPSNPGLNQDFDEVDALHIGGNFNNYGVFWSMNHPPRPEDLSAARARMEKTYRKRLEVMAGIEAKSPDDARQMATITDHCAADYFGVSTSWHRTDLIPKNTDAGKVDCAVCGEKIFAAAKLCVHCGAPTDEERQERWLEAKFHEKRGPGRPVGS